MFSLLMIEYGALCSIEGGITNIKQQEPSDADLCYPNADGLTNSKRSSIPETPLKSPRDLNNDSNSFPDKRTFNDNERTDEAEETFAVRRGNIGEMPGWGYGDSASINPNTYMDSSLLADGVSSKEPKFKCKDCLDCEDKDNTQNCCGCVCMRCKYVFSDIPYCADCDDTNPANEVPWPGSSFSLTKRQEDDEDLKLALEERANTNKANIGYKSVTVCKQQWSGKAGLNDYRYPSFPQDVTKTLASLDNGIWTPISS
jgi:hypothetical protein